MDESTRKAVFERPIRVLFISQDCQVQRYTAESEYAYWYEGAFASIAGGRAQVGIAYEADDEGASGSTNAMTPAPFDESGIAYYPIRANLRHGATGAEWIAARDMLLEVVEQFDPDVIQCFGSEWPHAAIAEDVHVPVVVHMMGFLNIYYPAIGMAQGSSNDVPLWRAAIRKLSIRRRQHDDAKARMESNAAFERRVMRANRFFLGRTEWDRNIVRYYSPGSRYFDVPELLRFPFVRDASTWRYHFEGKLRLLTVASADDRKGLEILLRTAELLKEVIGIDFEWRIAGNEQGFERFERRCGIRHNDVNVRLLGMLEAEDIVGELRHADLFVHPSIIDNSPRAICEAQIVGCPSVSSYVGGVPQLVEHGVTGFLYPYNEPHTLAFCVANLAEQRELLTNVSEAASVVARKRHDSRAIVDRMLNVYEEVIAAYEE